MMKLFSMAGTCALSVHIVLEWIGAPFEVDVMERGENHGAGYLAINSSGQVPALLLDDGQVLTEAAAILPFLADSFPAAGLAPQATPLGRYALAQLLSVLTGEVHVAFKPFFMPQRFITDEAQFDAVRAQAFVVLAPMLAELDARIGMSEFVLGARRSVADAYLYVLLRWVDNAPDGIAPYRNLARYRAAAEEDPAVQRALLRQGMAPVGAG